MATTDTINPKATTQHEWVRDNFNEMIFNPWFKEDRKKMIFHREGFPTACVPKYYELEWSEENRDKAVRYVLFMYDKKSPLRSVIPDLTERKQEAAILAGFDISSTQTADYVKGKSLFMLDNQWLREMVFGCLRYQNDRAWSLLVTTEQTLWENNHILLTAKYKKGEADAKEEMELQKKKADLIKMNKMLDETCKEYEAVIFGDNEDVKEAASVMRSSVRPEEIARAKFKKAS